ncbi:MAG: 50S ribosomal protein L35ae [Candidatus Nezhaarchaeota archaeon]|nr:50S ribosomal protein L35ae [Candidatus Nezhaarchaeota archaeon]MCX8141181.1 50S ribosomal protein L35ae [Candidatus Nezhaarchaeota archaeon]
MIVGRVLSFRLGMNRRYPRELLVKLGESEVDVAKLVGKKVVIEDQHGNKYIGKVLKPHGGKGVAVVRFRKDLPGQVIGLEAKVIES